jgi:transcriptional regulator with XRE-family HTH domain
MDRPPELDRACRKVGKRVARLRAGRELTQQEFAERAGLDYKYVQRIEGGKVNVSLATLLRLAKALRVRLPELLK